MVLDNAGFEMRNYYDVKEKEVVLLTENMYFYNDNDKDKLPDWQKEEFELARNIQENPDRYVYIEPLPSYEKYNLMEEFASMQKERLRELLFVALNGKGAFRRFKDVLLNFPEERQKWFDFENEWMEKKAIEFLDDIKES
jgi:hypothetical protein